MTGDKGFEAYRDYYGVRECLRCSASMEGVNHHYKCNLCWFIEKLTLACEHIDELFKEVRKNETL